MKASEFAKHLKLFKVDRYKVLGDKIQVPCIFEKWRHQGGKDKTPSSYFYFKPGEPTGYHCFGCGVHGSLAEIVLRLRQYAGAGAYQYGVLLNLSESLDVDVIVDVPDYEESEDQQDTVIQVWDGRYLESFGKASDFKVAIDYMKERGFPFPDWESLDLRYDTGRCRVCFPQRDFDGNLVGLRGRDITGKSGLKYLAYKFNGTYNSAVWYGEDTVKLEEPYLLLTESLFDYVSLARVFPRSRLLASLTCSVSKSQLARIRWAREIITVYDYGKGGDIARKTVNAFFSDIPVRHIIPSPEIDDAGAMPFAEVKRIYDSIESIDIPDY